MRAVRRLAGLFFSTARRYVGRIAATIAVVAVASAAKAGQGYLLKPVVDDLPQMKDFGRLRLLALLALGFAAGMFVFGVLRDYLTNFLNKRIVNDLRARLVRHMTHLPLARFHDRKSGDLVSRTTNDINAVEPAANFFFDSLLTEPVMLLCAVGLIFLANWQLALICLVGFPLYVVPLVRLGKAMRKARKRSLESLGDMTQAMVETLGGIKVVKAFNREEEQIREFEQHNEAFFRRLMRAMWKRALGENFAQLFIGVTVALLLFGGGFLLLKGLMTAGDMAVFGMAIAMMNSSVRELTKSWNRLLEASAACDRILDILDLPRDAQHDEGDELRGLGEGVEFRGVTFRYDAEPVLTDIRLSAAPGEVVALVGRSGAGKTTLCDLLCRFYDPLEGSITIGGQDIRTVRRSSLLRHVAVVGQDTFLFNASLRDNIRYSRPDASDADVEAAAKAAHIHDFIASLERGYDAVVGDRGAKLSGGQRQRVAIARAILKDPDVLILDEATSALDNESERAVQQALTELIRGGRRRITLVIAHRLSTVRDADRIVVLEEGRIVQQGRHDVLLGADGPYARFYRLQAELATTESPP